MIKDNGIKGRIIGGIVLFAMALLLLVCARYIDNFAEWYTNDIYSLLVNSVGRIFGIFPFSMSEIVLYGLCMGVISYLAYIIIIFCRKGEYIKEIKRFLSRIFLLSACLAFLYAANCGVNYYHISFSESAGMETDTYTAEELKELCLRLTDDVNQSCDMVERSEEGIMSLGDDEVNRQAVEAMHALGTLYKEMDGYYPRPKGLVNPWILSVQNLTGVYSPFTIEANYNSGMPDYNIPFTACHELSHLRGFMQEEEANFIAYLACMNTENASFRYSGSMLAWIYSMNALRRVDAGAWGEVRELLSEAAATDLEDNSAYWAGYDGRIAETANQINNAYLKANGQSDGVESYDRMVDLLVAYYYN